ncbi:MAG: type II toxin-antitoxin system prevent-host-death family antitoxin [Oscillospiraceae bacterium]|nr:type II toxin-antitoxin system prevent-host-death family antitoxin [Oscillospiraceae bacterium]
MYKTHVRPVRDIRNNYAELNELANNDGHVIITHNGRGTAALIGIEEFAKYEAYLYERYVNRKLDEAEMSAKDPNTKWLDEEEFWKPFEDLFA